MRVLFLASLFISLNLIAQPREVEITRKFVPEKLEFILIAKNNTSVYKTVVIKFGTLSNLDPGTNLPAIVEVSPNSSRQAIRLTKSGVGNPNFNYTYTYYTGCKQPEHDKKIRYALPVGSGKSTQPLKLTSLGNYIKNDEIPENWNAIGFTMEAGDTIFCSRRGVVENIYEDSKFESSGFDFTNNINRLTIRQDDCTIARYSNFETDNIFVKVGQRIEVGEPLGIVNSKPYGKYIHARQSFYATPLEEQIRSGKTKFENIYFPITYETKNGEVNKWKYDEEYTSILNEEIITQEMSRREVKEWIKAN